MTRNPVENIGVMSGNRLAADALRRASNRRVICGALLAIACAPGSGASAQTLEWPATPSTLHHYLVGDNGLPEITATVQVPSIQPDASAGFQVLVDIANLGPQEIKLVEPVENLFIEVRNAAGQVVGLPWIPLGLRGHRFPARDPALRERLRRADEDERHFQARELASSERNPAVRAKSLGDLVENQYVALAPAEHFGFRGMRRALPIHVALAPGEHFQFVAVVTTVLADPDAYAKAHRHETEIAPGDDGLVSVTGPGRPPGRFVPERAEIVRLDPSGAEVVICGVQPIAPGAYRLQVRLMLTTAEQDGAASIRKSDPITVQLGRE